MRYLHNSRSYDAMLSSGERQAPGDWYFPQRSKGIIVSLDWDVRKVHSLADQEDINGAQIELVKVGEGSQTIVGRVHSSVKLADSYQHSALERRRGKL